MVSAAGLCFCFVMTAILLSIGTAPCAYAATVFVFIFQLFLGIGYLPVPWCVLLSWLYSCITANNYQGSILLKFRLRVSELELKRLVDLSIGFVFVS